MIMHYHYFFLLMHQCLVIIKLVRVIHCGKKYTIEKIYREDIEETYLRLKLSIIETVRKMESKTASAIKHLLNEFFIFGLFRT